MSTKKSTKKKAATKAATTPEENKKPLTTPDELKRLSQTAKRLTESLMDLLRQDQPALSNLILLLSLLDEYRNDSWAFGIMTGEALEIAYTNSSHSEESRDAFIRELRGAEMKGVAR